MGAHLGAVLDLVTRATWVVGMNWLWSWRRSVSGTGHTVGRKDSLVHAGVIGRLLEGKGCPDRASWLTTVHRPHAGPMHRLAWCKLLVARHGPPPDVR